MKHFDKMDELEKANLLESFEFKRIEEIKQLEAKILEIKQNIDTYIKHEEEKYEQRVKDNNRKFCKCGIKYYRPSFGKARYRCGKEYCGLYEW
jgi:hypothetical protein